MAQIYSNISIVCFFLSAAFFVVSAVIFFSFHIMDVVREIRGQSQIKWVLSRDSQKKARKFHAEKGEGILLNETATEYGQFEEEIPTTMDNGDIKMESLVGFYEDKTELAEVPLEEPETEDPTGRISGFKVIESILYIHTDEEI